MFLCALAAEVALFDKNYFSGLLVGRERERDVRSPGIAGIGYAW